MWSEKGGSVGVSLESDCDSSSSSESDDGDAIRELLKDRVRNRIRERFALACQNCTALNPAKRLRPGPALPVRDLVRGRIKQRIEYAVGAARECQMQHTFPNGGRRAGRKVGFASNSGTGWFYMYNNVLHVSLWSRRAHPPFVAMQL